MSDFPSKEKALGMYKKMYEIRKYEESIYYLFLEGIMPGTIHQSTGEEASAVGMLYDLSHENWMASTHRPAGHDIAKGISVKAMMCEMFGKAEGCCGGKGGAMHTGDISVGAMVANAIVGGNLPIAAGVALAFKMQKKNNVVVCFFGDGASNEGSYHETMNVAGLWKLPVIFVCENNLYSATTSISLTCLQENVAADRAAIYGIPSEVVDGNDVLAVNEAATRAIARARAGEGPTILELKTYRHGGHSRLRLPPQGGGGRVVCQGPCGSVPEEDPGTRRDHGGGTAKRRGGYRAGDRGRGGIRQAGALPGQRGRSDQRV